LEDFSVNELSVKKRTSKLAIASLAFGIVNLFILSVVIIDVIDWDFFHSSHFSGLQNINETLGDWKIAICAVPVILSLIFGWISLVKIQNENNLRGKPVAIFGIACAGAFILFFLCCVIVFFSTGFK
jgi:hypothetical protein